VLSLGLAGCGETATAESDASEAPYYEGKSITLVVPYGPGGGTDTTARILATHLEKNIEGNPTVTVKNQAGGGGAVGFNTVARAEADGLTLVISSADIPQAWLRGTEGHDYDLAEMGLHGAFSSASVWYARTDVMKDRGIRDAGDLADIDQPLSVGHIANSGILPLMQQLVRESVGAELDVVTGFDGTGEATLALVAGEMNAGAGSVSGYLDKMTQYVDDDLIEPLFQDGLVNADGELVADERLADVPTVKDLFEAYGESPKGELWDAIYPLCAINSLAQAIWSAPGIPDAAAEALDAGFKKAVSSPEYEQDVLKQSAGLAPVLDAEAARTVFSSIKKTDDAAIAVWERVTGR
jgi:tripartite-type tricarboxylate transporter receptor subunit TctC